MSYLLGIDVGSTNLKAVLFGTDGRMVAKHDVATECCHPDQAHPEWAVWHPEQIWSGLAQAVRAVTSAVAGGEILGVAVTGMGMDGVPIDQAGKWLYPFISWHCPRTAPQQAWWLEHIGADAQFARGGNQVWTFNTALRLRWMQEHEPAILRKTHKWLLIEDYVNFMLCGETATDYSMASTTLLFDQRTRRWNDDFLQRSGIDRALLCEPLPAGTLIGRVHQAAAGITGLKMGTPVVLGGHDYCCGCLPTGAFDPGVLLDVLGTWEMVVTALCEPVLTPEVQRMGVVVDSHVARDRYAAMGATVAADMLEWFKREIGLPSPPSSLCGAESASEWAQLIDLAAQSPIGSNGVFFLPHMSGSFCPVLDPTSTGAFVGLRNIAGRGDLFRAVIEGLNYQFLEIIRAFHHALGVPSEKIVVIGGPTKNRLWMQNKADVTGIVVEVPNLAEAVPLGAAILAGIGTGVYRDEQDAFSQVYRPGTFYVPDPHAQDRYRDLYARYEVLYPSLKTFA
ncbi:MAG: FGGY-family carbohydrate kinase [Verrucomicrobia bacterium]|nr:FGGY-family carbohydrate kinase [Verrucomicrobiota bacterium]